MEKISYSYIFKLGGSCAGTALAIIGLWEMGLQMDTARLVAVLLSLAVGGYIFVQQFRMRGLNTQLAHLNDRILQMSLEDELTGTGNRKAAVQALENQIRQATRYKSPLSVMVIDIDNFKRANERYGLPAGDQLLCHMAESLKAAVRKSDMVFRLAGNEFFMIFPRTDLEKCIAAVDNILSYMKVHPCRLKAAVLPVQLSMGLAQARPDESVDALLHRAHIKLFEAKDAGGNCIRY